MTKAHSSRRECIGDCWIHLKEYYSLLLTSQRIGHLRVITVNKTLLSWLHAELLQRKEESQKFIAPNWQPEGLLFPYLHVLHPKNNWQPLVVGYVL